jgi:hypothetical protein
MQSLDAFFAAEELTIVATGCAHPPVVINQDNGASTVLRPADIKHTVPGHLSTVVNGPPQTTLGGYWGQLAIAPEAGEVRLHLVEGSEVSRCTVRRKVQLAAVQKQRQPKSPERKRRR